MSKKFRRQEWSSEKKVGTSWRKPRGINSKMRMRQKGKCRAVRIGSRTATVKRGFHPSGLKEFLIKNEKQLETVMKLDKKSLAIRISSSIGARKKALILKKADENKLKILNR
ncbi:MAG: eL32 family ribosomal protein [archaeon]